MSVAMGRLPRHPCPVCGRRIAATTTSLYATRREGKWFHYVYLRIHNNPQGQRCPGATATVETTHPAPLLPERKDHAMTETTTVQMIPVEAISPSPLNPRSDLGEIGELAASITSLGIIQPLTVRPTDDGRYLLVAGERRYAAALAAGLTEVPAIVRELDDETALEIALVEICQRRDLNPTDE